MKLMPWQEEAAQRIARGEVFVSGRRTGKILIRARVKEILAEQEEKQVSEETTIETAICQCGAEISIMEEGGDWMHTRIEDFSHKAMPLTNQPPPKDHENYDYLMERYEEELAAEQHLKQGVVDARVEAYDAHVREIETPGYVPAASEGDSFAEWMYNRLRKQGRLDDDAWPWADLDSDAHDFWRHEAQAYRRASARGGFKDYDPEKSKL